MREGRGGGEGGEERKERWRWFRREKERERERWKRGEGREREQTNPCSNVLVHVEVGESVEESSSEVCAGLQENPEEGMSNQGAWLTPPT